MRRLAINRASALSSSESESRELADSDFAVPGSIWGFASGNTDRILGSGHRDVMVLIRQSVAKLDIYPVIPAQ